MINIKNKKNCCGCSACVQRCPQQCITLSEDSEGFLYPKVNLKLCTNCNLCEKVCPILTPLSPQLPQHCYAGINQKEQVRLNSSSGGIFSLLAEKTIQEGGIVFGARFDEFWEVKHDYTKDKEGITAFRGSKYVQSRIEDNYQKTEKFLKEGEKILFSGTPCQIAGLKKFLRKEYENLVTIDFICHGVPSPLIWRKYIDDISKIFIENKISSTSSLSSSERKSYIEKISFRHKISGWKKFSFYVKFSLPIKQDKKNTKELVESFSENLFMKGFLKDLYLRPSCYNCPFKKGKSRSDITLADFWGIQNLYPDWDDDKGTSAIFINNNKGIMLINKIKEHINYKEVNYNDIVNSNKSYESSCNEPHYRSLFFKKYGKKEHLDNSLFQQTLKDRIILKIKKHLI